MTAAGFHFREGVRPVDPEWVGDARQPKPAGYVEDAYRRLLHAAEGGGHEREGLADTPARAARAWAELTIGYRQDPADLFRTFEADGYDELVMVGPIPFYSLCEHHLLPFHGDAWVGYIPAGRIVGLSKIARLVDVFARRLQVQERLTAQVADTLNTHLEPLGVIVVVAARHLCMEMRGVQTSGAGTTTSAVRGAFRDDPAAREEALSFVHRGIHRP